MHVLDPQNYGSQTGQVLLYLSTKKRWLKCKIMKISKKRKIKVHKLNLIVPIISSADDNFPYFVNTPVIEGDFITMGEIIICKELIPWLYNISARNSIVNYHNIPL